MFEEDDYPDDDRVIGRTQQGAAFVMPASVRRLPADVQELYAELQRTALEIYRLEREAADLVAQARAGGVSWSVIGAAVGITGVGAAKRYGGSNDE